MTVWNPREYQALMLRHAIEHRRCAWWAGMGMGKTSTAYWLLDALEMAGEDPYPALVLGPLRVARDVWADEAHKWENFQRLKVQPIIGDVDQRVAALRNDKAQVYPANYDIVPWLVARFGADLATWPFRTVIADEAVRLKNHRAQGGGVRAQSLAAVAFHKRVHRWINLTGAPAPNGLIDLWGQTWFLDGGYRLGLTFTDFQNRWFGYQRASDAINAHKTFVKRVVFPHSQAEIEAKLKDICLTVDPKDWFDLKQPIFRTVKVKLPRGARKHYREMERELFTQIRENNIEAFSPAGKAMKCLQIASGFAFTDPDARAREELHDEKIEALRSIVAETNGEPILCGYFFKPSLARLLKAFPKAADLNTPRGMAAFKAGDTDLGFGHPQSIGHGVDGLQHRCHVVVFYESWWDMDPDQQFIDRVGPTRQAQAGYERPTWVYRIVAEDTVDEDVVVRLATKRSVQDVLMDAMKQRGG